MNKKFSTLVASLLLSSAFSVYAGNAKPMLATPTQVETRAISEDVEKAVELAAGQTLPVQSLSAFVVSGTEGEGLAAKVLSGFTNDSRLAYVGSVNAPFSVTTPVPQAFYLHGAFTAEQNTSVSHYTSSEKADYYWTLLNGTLLNDNGRRLSVEDLSDNYEIVPLKEAGKETSQFFAIARRTSDGKIQYVKVDNLSGSSVLKFTDVADDYNAKITEAALFVSVETAYSTSISATGLNTQEKDGFKMNVYSKIDKTLSIVNADVFAGVLNAVEEDALTGYYRIQNAAKEYIVFDSKANVTSDGYSKMGQFKTTKNIDATNDYSYFKISKADNGSEDVLVYISSADGNSVYRLYIANTANTYALTIAGTNDNPVAENWAGVTLGDGDLVDLRQFLTGQYYTIDYVKKNGTATTSDAYKTGGRLAILNDKADYVSAKSLYEKAPEAQWAVTSGDSKYFDETITLTNRENPGISFKITQLRRDNGAFIATIDGADAADGIDTNDVIKITAVENHDKHDGYKVFTKDELKNMTWYLGQIRKVEGETDVNAYWAENHDGSHQIGATVDVANAAKWNVSLVTKNTALDKYKGETDSVLVVSTLNEWNAEKSRIDAKQDTLVIFPYAFQNRNNGEFVEFNGAKNLEYYQCREYTTAAESVFAKGELDATTGDIVNADARFALKLKANGEYNYVVLPARVARDYATTVGEEKGNVIAISVANAVVEGSKKVYNFNSADYATWGNMAMYAKDANSLMFVTPVDAPEYRKLVAENGIDSVTIYRADNDKQVVYEKRDDKGSALLERPVSFLNIDNIAQYPEINSSLYVDSAYVNRGNNTCYQYLLGVDVKETRGYYCPLHGFVEGDSHPCTSHAQRVVYKQGRYLMNMIDTANVLAEELKVSIHNNPFINETTEGNTCAKLAFVDAIHVLTDSVDMTKSDTLYVINNADARDKYTAIPLSSDALNTVKFAFKYVDSNVNEDFKIQTLWKEYAPNKDAAKREVSEEGYLRWVNGCVVVDKGYMRGDVFNMNEDETRTPTANEEIATSSVVVAGTNGAVVVKGAEGKNVIVSTILGKVVANEVVSSDNATIAAPAGVVVVSVDGESFKVVVK